MGLFDSFSGVVQTFTRPFEKANERASGTVAKTSQRILKGANTAFGPDTSFGRATQKPAAGARKAVTWVAEEPEDAAAALAMGALLPYSPAGAIMFGLGYQSLKNQRQGIQMQRDALAQQRAAQERGLAIAQRAARNQRNRKSSLRSPTPFYRNQGSRINPNIYTSPLGLTINDLTLGSDSNLGSNTMLGS